MPVLDREAFAASLLPGERLIGLDLGTRTIGIARSDIGRSIATADRTLKRTKFTADAKTLLAIIEAERAGGLVLGLPLNMNGSEGPRAQATRGFARNLANLSPVPMLLWDERLSTAAVERMMISADLSRKRRAEVIDAAAASFILQGVLDWLSGARIGS